MTKLPEHYDIDVATPIRSRFRPRVRDNTLFEHTLLGRCLFRYGAQTMGSGSEIDRSIVDRAMKNRLNCTSTPVRQN